MRAITAGITIWALLVLSGCAGTGTPRDETWRDRAHPSPVLDLPVLTTAPCPGQEQPRASASFTMALPGGVEPARAPLARTEAERHLFRNLYETLVRIDCAGRIEPGLAQSWQAYDGGRRWVLRLRDNARFWDGTPLGAIHVLDAWRRVEALCEQFGEPTPFLRFQPRGASLQILGPRELAIDLPTPDDLLPWLLAHPHLAVVGGGDDLGWPTGSGPLRPLNPGASPRLVLVPAPGHPLAPIWRDLTILLGADQDPRELLDAGAAALVTREREVVAYYRGRPGTSVDPLPWDRSYFLVVPTEPTGVADRDRRRWTAGWDPLELAREVSRQEAEPAPFFAFEPMRGACPVLPPVVPARGSPSLAGRTVQASRDTDLVLWPRSDPDAGRLAERLAALAARPLGPGPERPGTGPLTRPPAPAPGIAPEALAVADDELAAHIHAARAGAVVLPWPHRWPLPCEDLASLLAYGDWLVEAGLESELAIRAIPPGATPAQPFDDLAPTQAEAVARRLERSQAVQPLLRTRAVLIRHPWLAGLACDHDGALRLWTGGWRQDPH